MTPPDVRVVRGEPDDDELAALVAGLAAGSAVADRDHHQPAHDDAAHAGRRRWRAAAGPGQESLVPGHDAWRWSARR